MELGKSSYSFGENMFLLTSLELPVISQVAVASKEKPYLAFFLKLDIATARDILNTEEVDVREAPVGPGGMAIGHSTVEIISCCSRILDLLDSPKDMNFMGKLLRREMTYRLLQSSQGARLRAIAMLGEQNNRSAKAVASLRANYQKPLNIDTLADLAEMGRSTLHHHFRALTAMSPLKFKSNFVSTLLDSECCWMKSTQLARHTRWDTKARTSSIESTDAISVAPRCETYKLSGWRTKSHRPHNDSTVHRG